MLTITHKRARFTLKPENVQETRELLALIDKTDGQKGAKLKRPKADAKHDSMKREYPAFYAGMETGEYLNKFHELNERKMLSGLAFTFANRAAPMLDASAPEVLEELDPDYVFTAKPQKATVVSLKATIQRAVTMLESADQAGAIELLKGAVK